MFQLNKRGFEPVTSRSEVLRSSLRIYEKDAILVSRARKGGFRNFADTLSGFKPISAPINERVCILGRIKRVKGYPRRPLNKRFIHIQSQLIGATMQQKCRVTAYTNTIMEPVQDSCFDVTNGLNIDSKNDLWLGLKIEEKTYYVSNQSKLLTKSLREIT